METSAVEQPSAPRADRAPIDLHDITIIGGGPVGLFGLFYAGMRGMKAKVIDSLAELGGQLAALYPDKYVYDMAGFRKVLARDLADGLKEQALQFSPTVCLEEKVVELRQENGLMVLATEAGREHWTKTVLITAGVGAFAPRKLESPELARFEGHGLHYFIRSVEHFAGRRVLIAGGGDSAVDWALHIEPMAKEVTLIHRRETFRAHEDSLRKLRASRTKVLTFYELRTILGDSRVARAVIYDNRTQEEQALDVDDIIVNFGFRANLGPIKNWGLTIQGNSIVVNQRMETNIPGVYAAGDVVSFPGKLKLIATGVGEAATAVCTAKLLVDPNAHYFPGHSSDSKTFEPTGTRSGSA
jgi:thioredoxin reductase (NADPH)